MIEAAATCVSTDFDCRSGAAVPFQPRTAHALSSVGMAAHRLFAVYQIFIKRN
jgi:hypothetical protein